MSKAHRDGQKTNLSNQLICSVNNIWSVLIIKIIMVHKQQITQLAGFHLGYLKVTLTVSDQAHSTFNPIFWDTIPYLEYINDNSGNLTSHVSLIILIIRNSKDHQGLMPRFIAE